jgi:predicted ATPase/DNA-binding CsgD family transcriptional regulator
VGLCGGIKMSGTHVNSIEGLPEPLTRREREVLGLLGQGLTAPEIAERLVIAVSSVKYHIQHVYGKLGVHGRRQAVARARELNLLHATSPAPPPASTADKPSGVRHNLPQPLTRLIGRERDLQAISELWIDSQTPLVRVVTLVGAGGSGKTRLALAVAHAALAGFCNRVWLVELAPLSHGGLVAHSVAASLGLRDETTNTSLRPAAAHPQLALLIKYLQSRHCLLVLDNCEHVVDACARLAEALLQTCPHLQILATSREPLKVAGEALWPVTGLEMPPVTPPPGSALEHAASYAAVQLFAERARAARPGFRVTSENASSVAQVCRQLDGLPLAIELAAARVALLTVEQIAAMLAMHEGFRLLTGGARTALLRQQTLRATIDWSYQLLSPPERKLLRRLPAFAGGWTLAAAEAICADPGHGEAQGETALPARAVFDALSQLVDKSLVVSDPTAGPDARFHLLETIREFALDTLEESGEAHAVRRQHFDFFLQLAEQAEPETRGPDQLAWHDRLEADHDNLRRALVWAMDNGETDGGLRLASALHFFWEVRGYLKEGYDWFKRLLAGNFTPQPSVAWAMGLARAARFANCFGDETFAGPLGRASLALSRALGVIGQASAAYALLALAWIRFWQDRSADKPEVQYSSATFNELQQECLAQFATSGDAWGHARALLIIGSLAEQVGDYQRAGRAYEHGRALFEQHGDQSSLAGAFSKLGELATWNGEYQRAVQAHQAAASQLQQLHHWDGYADALWNLALAQENLGAYASAIASLGESIGLLRSLGHLAMIPPYLVDQASMVYACGDYTQASALLEESHALAIALGDPLDRTVWIEVQQARIDRARGDPAGSLIRLENTLPVLRAGGHQWWMAFAQEAMGEALRDLGEYDRAATQVEASLAWFRAGNRWREVTGLLILLGSLARRQGDHPRAASLLGESLQRCVSSGLRPLMARCLAEIAYLFNALAPTHARLAEAEHAAHLLAAYAALCQTLGFALPPADHGDRAEYDHATTTLRTRLGTDRLDALWDQGGAMSAAAAASYAFAALEEGHA